MLSWQYHQHLPECRIIGTERQVAGRNSAGSRNGRGNGHSGRCRGSVATGAKTSGASHDCRYDRKFKFALVEFRFHTFSFY